MTATHLFRPRPEPSLGFLAGGGELGADMRRKDWASTPLGDAEGWPQSLRTSVSICLSSRMPVLVWWGRDLVMLYNDAYRELIGAKHPAALGQPGRECWPEIWHVIGPMLDAVLSRGESTFSEDLMLPLERKGFPEECYFTFSYSPIRDEAGGVGGVFCSVVETTAQVLAARRTRTLRRLADATSVRRTEADALAMSMKTLGEEVADVSWALYQPLVEGKPEPPVSVGLERPEVEALAPVLAACVERARTSRSAQELPSSAEDLAGPRGWVLPIGKSGSAPSGVVVLGRSPMLAFDETYRTFFELVTAALASSLETARAFDVVVRARQEAEEANRTKDEFLAMLGHELRNPLSPMMTALELMRLRAPDVLERERGILERQVEHLARLVDDLLDVSRIARGKVELKREEVELASIVASAVEQASPILEERGHYLRLSVHRTGLRVVADPGRLAQVFFNLLHNAAKYTDPGGHLTIVARREGSEVALSVRDDGVGIAPDLQPRVFETFFQGRQDRDRAKGGLGLGLALVKSLTELHGGRVEVESPGLGLGSTFTVWLPLAIEAWPTERVQPDGEPARPAADRGLRILVVDDNVDAAESIAEVLELLGNRVRVAHDGVEALRVAREDVPDLALLDIGLPVIDGYELAERLRSEHPALRLVAVSGYGQDGDRAAALRAGFSRHLVKPVSLEEIESVVTGDAARSS
jgi:signal transduction histidine kinase/CheY-like chemotaxis protein